MAVVAAFRTETATTGTCPTRIQRLPPSRRHAPVPCVPPPVPTPHHCRLQVMSGVLHRQCFQMDSVSEAWVAAAKNGTQGPSYCKSPGSQSTCGPGFTCLDIGYGALPQCLDRCRCCCCAVLSCGVRSRGVGGRLSLLFITFPSQTCAWSSYNNRLSLFSLFSL